MSFEILTTAHRELDEAIDYYNRQRPGLGDEFLAEVKAAFARIRDFPASWPRLSARTRRCRTKRFSYGVAYRHTEGLIQVLSIAHLHRDPGGRGPVWDRSDVALLRDFETQCGTAENALE